MTLIQVIENTVKKGRSITFEPAKKQMVVVIENKTILTKADATENDLVGYIEFLNTKLDAEV